MPLSPKTRCNIKSSGQQRLKTRGDVMMSSTKEQVPLLPVLSDLKPKTPKVSPLFSKNKGRDLTKFLSKTGRKVRSVMPSPHDVSASPYYSNGPKKEKSSFKQRERTKKKSKSARKYRRRHITKRRTGKTVKASRKIRDLALTPRVKLSKKTKNNIGFPSYLSGSIDSSSLKDQIFRSVNVHGSENVKLFAEEKISLLYPADRMLSTSEKLESPRKNPGCAAARTRTPLKSTRDIKRSVQNSYDRAIWKQIDILKQEMTQYPMSMEEQIGTSLRYHLELINDNQDLDLGNSIDVFRRTIDKYRELVNSISLQLANMILHKQSEAGSIRKELEKAKLTIEDKNALISSLVKKQMLDTKELSRLYNSLMSNSKEKLAKDFTWNEMQGNSESYKNSGFALKENSNEKPDGLKERLPNSESELKKLKLNFLTLKKKVDAMESSNIYQSPTKKFGEGESIVECCAEAQNLNKNFQAKVFGKMIHFVKLDTSGPSTGKTSASLMQGRFEESILEAKELSRWSEMLKSELSKLQKLADNNTTLQVSDNIILRHTISELLESECIINKSLLALNRSNVHRRHNLTASRKLSETTSGNEEDLFYNNSKEDESNRIADDQAKVDESEQTEFEFKVGFNAKPDEIGLVSGKNDKNVNRHKSKNMTNNKQVHEQSFRTIPKIIITQLEDETQNMSVCQTEHLTILHQKDKLSRKRSSTISFIDIDAFRRKNIHCRKFWGSKNSSDVESCSPRSERNFNSSKMMVRSNDMGSLEPLMNCALVSVSGDEHLELENVQTIPENSVIHHRSRAKSISENWWSKQEKFKAYQSKLKGRGKTNKDGFLEQFGKKRCHSVDFSNTQRGLHSETMSPFKSFKKKVIIKEPSPSPNTIGGDSRLRMRRKTPYVGNVSGEIKFTSKLCPKNKSNQSETEKLL